MNFTRTIIRCPICPADFSTDIKTILGGCPSWPASAGIEFQIALFEDPQFTTLLDITNLSYFNVRIFQANADGTVLMDGDSAGVVRSVNPTLSLADWQSGIGQHVRMHFPSSLTNVASGTHFLVAYGIVQEDVDDYAVFGKCSPLIVDVGSLGPTSPELPPTDAATLAQVGILLDQRFADVVKRDGAAGDTITLRGLDGTVIILSAANGQLAINAQNA